jgi:phage terminase large subunit GpA-like protein
VLAEAFAEGMRPRTACRVSEWAERNRQLSGKAAAEPGPWRNARVPYLTEIMDVLGDDDPAQIVVFIKSGQVGATDAILNWVGWTIEESPAPMLAFYPSEKLGLRWSRHRLRPMLTGTPSLRRLVPLGRKGDAGSTLTEVDFRDGLLSIGSANIASDLSMTPAQRLALDEVDRFPATIEDEGDPVDLAIRRTATWNTRRKVFIASTPTIETLSRINRWWKRSDQRRYYVSCPHCGEFQYLKWDNLRWPEGQPKLAAYVCEACGSLIEEHHKTDMLARGEWRATFPEREVVGFHINCLYAPESLGDSWAQNALEFEQCKPYPERVKVFVNTRLGETHEDPNEKLDWEVVYARRESFPLRTPPSGVLVLTCGVDVQKNRLAVQVVGWGRNERATPIDWIEKPGDPTRPEVWAWLDEYLAGEFRNHRGVAMRIEATLIDAGYLQHDVLSFVRARRYGAVFGSKGMADVNRQIIARPSPVDVRYGGRVDKYGAEIYPIGTSTAKNLIFTRLHADADKPAGERHLAFSEDLTEDYFRQLCSEVFDPHKRRWVKVHERNEVLDTFVLALAAAMHHSVAINRFTEAEWVRREEILERAAPTPGATVSAGGGLTLEFVQAMRAPVHPSSRFGR